MSNDFGGQGSGRGVSAYASRRLALAVLSITLLGMAFIVPEVFGIALSLAAFAGLFALRLTAKPERWLPRGTTLRDWRAAHGTITARVRAIERDEVRPGESFAGRPDSSRMETVR